jgi:hypothetical protein
VGFRDRETGEGFGAPVRRAYSAVSQCDYVRDLSTGPTSSQAGHAARTGLTESIVIFGHRHVLITIPDIQGPIALENILLFAPPPQMPKDHPLDMPPLQWEIRWQIAFVLTIAIAGKGERQDGQGGDDGEPVDHRPAEWDTTPRRVEVVDKVQDVAESSTAVVGTSFGVRVVGDLRFAMRKRDQRRASDDVPESR